MFFSKSSEIMELVGDHSEVVLSCFSKYEEAIEDIFGGCDKGAIESYANQLRSLESQADEVRHQIIKSLLEGGLLVDSRKSLMHVIEETDRVADITENIIQSIYLQRIDIPKFMHEPILKMSKVTRKQLELLIETVKKVVHKYKIKEMSKVIQEIEVLESEVDDIQQGLTKQLFEQELELAKKMQLKELIEFVGLMSDTIEDISDQIEIIMMARKV